MLTRGCYLGLASALILSVACSQGEASKGGSERGDALRTSITRHEFGTTRAPRQEAINSVTSIVNRSDEGVILREIIVRTTREASRYGRVKRVLVHEPGIGGMFFTVPLVTKDEDGGPCDVQHLSRVKGYRVSPKERVDIAIWVRPLKEGRFRVGPVEIAYEQSGKLYSQVDTYWLDVKVARSWSRTVPKDVRDCANHGSLLPGNTLN